MVYLMFKLFQLLVLRQLSGAMNEKMKDICERGGRSLSWSPLSLPYGWLNNVV